MAMGDMLAVEVKRQLDKFGLTVDVVIPVRPAALFLNGSVLTVSEGT